MNNIFSRNKKITISIIFLLISLSLIFSLFLFGAENNCLNKKCFLNESRQLNTKVSEHFVSPYAEVDWNKINYYSGNFHTHTTVSDGSLTPDEVVKYYSKYSFDILAITDHDDLNDYKTSWPWSEIGVNLPRGNKVLAVEGSEITDVDNIGSFFSDYGGPAQSVDGALGKIGLKKGLAIMFHPGRYDESLEFYLNLYKKYPHLIGLEVFNKNNLYPHDLDLWDSLLDEIIPERFVWGFANDDMHNVNKDFGFNRNIFPLNDLTSENLRLAIEKGSFFFFRPTAIGGSPTIYLKSIEATDDSIKLEFTGDYQKIEWFSYNPQTKETEVVGVDKDIKINDIPEYSKFVRFVVTNDSGQLYSQPFKVLRADN